MTDPTPDRPLVTLALFSYNQEQYIREAVEGAFSQTYEPLEIILSDYCSSGQTYEIMQEMASVYEGPHEVRAQRNPFRAYQPSALSQTHGTAVGRDKAQKRFQNLKKPLHSGYLLSGGEH